MLNPNLSTESTLQARVPALDKEPQGEKGKEQSTREPVYVPLMATFLALGCWHHRPDIPTSWPLPSLHQNQWHQQGLCLCLYWAQMARRGLLLTIAGEQGHTCHHCWPSASVVPIPDVPAALP